MFEKQKLFCGIPGLEITDNKKGVTVVSSNDVRPSFRQYAKDYEDVTVDYNQMLNEMQLIYAYNHRTDEGKLAHIRKRVGRDFEEDFYKWMKDNEKEAWLYIAECFTNKDFWIENNEELTDGNIMIMLPDDLKGYIKRFGYDFVFDGIDIDNSLIVDYTIEWYKEITGYNPEEIFDRRGYEKLMNDATFNGGGYDPDPEDEIAFWNDKKLNDSTTKIEKFWRECEVDLDDDFWYDFDYRYREIYLWD